MKILIVDDNQEITDMLHDYLELADFDVHVINDGLSAFEAIKKDEFDKILLDLSMPEFSGFDILEGLKEKDFKYFNKIIILTASELDLDKTNKLKRLGIKYIFSKPLGVSKIIEAFESN